MLRSITVLAVSALSAVVAIMTVIAPASMYAREARLAPSAPEETVVERATTISRSLRAAPSPEPAGAPQPVVVPSVADARAYAFSQIGAAQFDCLDALWQHESDWDPRAQNPSSGAYGIAQALPASKMSAFGSDWSDNPITQVRWGLWYIAASYGSACNAWSFWQRHWPHWY